MKPNLDTIFSTRHGIAACCGSVILLFLALPGGYGFWPLLGVACVPFLVSINRGTCCQALFFGFFFGTAHFLVQLYWIVFVVGHYGGLPLYLAVPTLLLLCFYMAAYFVFLAVLIRGITSTFSPFAGLWLIPTAWVAMDYLGSLGFTAFPWMDIGYGAATVPLLMQSADIWGHYGITFLIILLNTCFAFCLTYKKQLKNRRAMALSVIVFLTVTLFYSDWRMRQVESKLLGAPTINIGIVQGNIDQAQKWNPARQGATVKTYLDQSSALLRSTPKPDLLLWPETALPFYAPGHPLLSPISRFLQNKQLMLLTGSPWYERESLTGDGLKLYNASLLFNTEGQIVNRTFKSHLVPFGEYVPFKKYLPFIAPLVEGVGDFIPGVIEDPPACKNAKIGVLICFESIFPDISRKWVAIGANLLVNITNDAWYGKSSAPYQTLAMTRFRAVETRRSIVRAANTGFSAFIDPLGRVQEESPLFVNWQSVRPVVLMEEQTVFMRGGFAFPLVCFILTLLASLLVVWKRQTS